MRLTLLRTLILINAVATLAAGVALFVFPGARSRRLSPACGGEGTASAVGRTILFRIGRTERKEAG